MKKIVFKNQGFIELAMKICALLLLVSLNWTGISSVVQTAGNYNDVELSSPNDLQAGTLDFELNSNSDFNPDTVCADQSSSRTIDFLNLANLTKYKANATSFEGIACDYLDLTASLDGNVIYTGSLKNFITGEILFSQPEIWEFKLDLQPGAPEEAQGQNCQFDFVFSGSQEKNNLVFGAGFTDNEKITNNVSICTWEKVLINKVYYDVSPEYGADPENEWIEIYNPSDHSIDISGWEICDNFACDVIPTSTPLFSQGFAVLTGTSTNWNYWNIPADVVKIILPDGEIGDGLASDSDMLLLKNASSTIVDQMNWGVPTSTWPNYNSNIWNPGVPIVAQGRMLARVPTGYDTDQSSDWKDLGLPQVQVIWPNGGEVIWVGQTVTLQWSALNPNGPDSDLEIDIWYSRNSGNSWVRIVAGTENDGAYDWRVPLYINGYYIPSHHARIKVVARGPENFMVWAWDMSDFDFCPPIDYSLLTDEEKAQVEQLLLEGILTEEDIINRDVVAEEVDIESGIFSGGVINIAPADDSFVPPTEEIVIDTSEATTSEESLPDEVNQEITTTTEEIATTTEETERLIDSAGTESNAENLETVFEEPVSTPAVEETGSETPIVESGENSESAGETLPVETSEPAIISESVVSPTADSSEGESVSSDSAPAEAVSAPAESASTESAPVESAPAPVEAPAPAAEFAPTE